MKYVERINDIDGTKMMVLSIPPTMTVSSKRKPEWISMSAFVEAIKEIHEGAVFDFIGDRAVTFRTPYLQEDARIYIVVWSEVQKLMTEGEVVINSYRDC